VSAERALEEECRSRRREQPTEHELGSVVEEVWAVEPAPVLGDGTPCAVKRRPSSNLGKAP
jgi:hypothetical protein